jgi:hypothetical protein
MPVMRRCPRASTALPPRQHSRRLLPAAAEAEVEDTPLPTSRATTAGEALRRFYDARSPLGAVRVVGRAVEGTDDDSRCLHEFEPFAKED